MFFWLSEVARDVHGHSCGSNQALRIHLIWREMVELCFRAAAENHTIESKHINVRTMEEGRCESVGRTVADENATLSSEEVQEVIRGHAQAKDASDYCCAN